MKLLTFTRSVLFACLMIPACGDDKADDSTTATDSAATPATPATPATATDTATGDEPTLGGDTGTATDSGPTSGSPTSDPSSDPSSEPTTDPSGDPSTDPTTDPTAGDGMYCQEQCAADGDCTAMGTDLGLTCVDGRCAGGCVDDNACIQTYSGWIMDCATQADCPGQACIDIGGGVGKCAITPSDFFMCDAAMLTEVMYPVIEGGSEVAVCANTSYECKDGACQNPCEADADCMLFPGQNKCDTGTGQCVCADDAACMAFNADTPVCTADGFCGCGDDSNCKDANYPKCGANNFCGCAEDANCLAAGTGDTCYDGACGCSGAAACTGTKVFDGTMFVCEGV